MGCCFWSLQQSQKIDFSLPSNQPPRNRNLPTIIPNLHCARSPRLTSPHEQSLSSSPASKLQMTAIIPQFSALNLNSVRSSRPDASTPSRLADVFDPAKCPSGSPISVLGPTQTLPISTPRGITRAGRSSEAQQRGDAAASIAASQPCRTRRRSSLALPAYSTACAGFARRSVGKDRHGMSDRCRTLGSNDRWSPARQGGPRRR